uniref:F-box only protein 27-like n=1 Tax=Pogona vitticeps TaxID=103695 RepID=A0ABM5ERV1_9SAUR
MERGARAEMQRPTDVNQLPDEVLELILSWVPARTLVARCRLVCRRWRDLIGRPTLWKLQCERDPALQAVLQAAQRCPRVDWCRVAVLRPFGRNLIKNPCGNGLPLEDEPRLCKSAQEQFRHWNIHFSKTRCFLEKSRRASAAGGGEHPGFTACYRWYSKSQVVDLLQEGFWEDLLDFYQPNIIISDRWDIRRSTGCEYSMAVTLLAADQASVIADFKAEPDSTSQRNFPGYNEVSHVFRNYGPGVRYIRFWHEGRDTQYWKGCFGIHFTNSMVLVKISQEPV